MQEEPQLAAAIQIYNFLNRVKVYKTAFERAETRWLAFRLALSSSVRSELKHFCN